MLQVHALQYRYPGTAASICVPQFTLDAGEHAVLLGPSGCGKSTLLHLFAGILSLQQGSLQVVGTDLRALTPRAADRWRGQTIGFLPQKLALIDSLSVRDNLLLAAYAVGATPRRERANALLDALGLAAKADARPGQLSQGQQQRVAIARALFNNPSLLLADEPTANLDDQSCQAALTLLLEQAEAIDASLVIATHDARVMAALPQAKVLRLPALSDSAVEAAP